MSETREAYNVTIQLGRELDALVAKVMGWEWTPEGTVIEPLRYKGYNLRYFDDIIPHYSTDPATAMQAWEWLEQNNPWQSEDGAIDRQLLLGIDHRESDGKPCVLFYDWHLDFPPDVFVKGVAYPHAIALAVIEVGRMKGLLE